MQQPTAKTPVTKCLELSTYTVHMLGKFPEHPVLPALAERLTIAARDLDAQQAAYLAAIRAILPTRVDVVYTNHVSDQRIRQTQRKAELHDGRKNGPVATQVFPEGASPITRLTGESQVEAMKNLEGRLAAAEPLWPEAAGEKAAITQHRTWYTEALTARAAAWQAARDRRALRNASKNRFLTAYAEVMSRIEAEFPRDKAMQELFFDDVRKRSAAAEADEEEQMESDTEPTT